MSHGLGRTNWFSEDAGLLRRELVFELGAEHGAAAQNVYRHLRDLAQEQRSEDGTILAGFRTVSTLAHVTPSECRRFVEAAAALGLLDDLDVYEDERRFTCRVSGWRADQDRGDATLRKRDQRDREQAEAEAEARLSRPDVTTPPLVTPRRDNDPSCHPLNTTPSTPEEKRESRPDRPASMSYRSKKVPSALVDRACALLAVFNEATGRRLRPVDSTGQPSEHLRQIVGALLTRSDVPLEQWTAAVRNTVAKPPSFVDGELQLGHIFGKKAADHALANTGGRQATSGGGAQLEARRAWALEHLPALPADWVATMLSFASGPLEETKPADIEAAMRRQWPHLFDEVAA